MENIIQKHRAFVAAQIEKSFNNEFQVPNQEVEKAYNVGDEKDFNGRTYYVHGIGKTGMPLWRLKDKKTKSDNEKKFKENFKDASDDVLQKIVEGKIQAGDQEKKWATDIINERKKLRKSEAATKKVIDLLTASSSKYTDIKKVVAFKTDKGNWAIDYDGANTGIILNGSKLSERELRTAGVKIEGINANKKTDDTEEADVAKKKENSGKKAVDNVVNAIKSSGLFSDNSYSYGKMGKIASINVGEPNTRNGNISATVIYQTRNGSYKSVSVNIDAKGKVEKESGWQSSQAFAELDDAKSYVEYGRRGRNIFNLKWEDSAGVSSTTKNNQGKTGSGFNIVGARAQDISDNVAEVLGGKVVGDETVKVSGIPGATIKAYKIKVGNDSFFIHDGVFERSYSSKGYARYKGFTVMKEDGSKIMRYKVNSAGNRFTNALSTTAGELGSYIKNTWGYGK